VVRHPYRARPEEAEAVDKAPDALNTEELVLYAVIGLIGVVGVLVGVVASRSTELCVGLLMTGFAVYSFASSLAVMPGTARDRGGEVRPWRRPLP
jgi:hypothetical protein